MSVFPSENWGSMHRNRFSAQHESSERGGWKYLMGTLQAELRAKKRRRETLSMLSSPDSMNGFSVSKYIRLHSMPPASSESRNLRVPSESRISPSPLPRSPGLTAM